MNIGTQVHLKFSPDCKGTVSAVEPGRVRVTWPQRYATVEKTVIKLGRTRVWYDNVSFLRAFAV